MNIAAVPTHFPGATSWPLATLDVSVNMSTDVQSALGGIAPGPPEVIYSSAASAWKGFLVEKHVCSPGVRAPAMTDRHVISLLCGRAARFEYGSQGCRGGLSIEPPGSLTIIPTGQVPGVRLHSSAEFTHCALDEDFTRGVLNEMEPRPCGQPVFRVGVLDTGIQRILDLLVHELEADAPTGRLYVESLVFALATRYLLLFRSGHGERQKPQTAALPQQRFLIQE